jgi:hypothetical protein
MFFHTSVHINYDCIPSLDEKTKCLQSILDNASIEVEVEVDFEYEGGHSGNYENPPESPEANYTDIYVKNISFDADTPQIEENIKVLISNEQKEAIVYLATLIIERDWQSKYEQEAFDSLPEPDDYADDYDDTEPEPEPDYTDDYDPY